MKKIPARLFVYILAFFHAFEGVYAYTKGDLVSVVEQSQIGNMKTKWRHMQNGKKPKFATNSIVNVVPPYSRQDYDTTLKCKMTFAFSDHRFLVPWLTLSDGKGLYLAKIIFTFTYHGDDIASVRAQQVYMGEGDVDKVGISPNHKPGTILFEYIWEPHKPLYDPYNSPEPLVAVVLCSIFVFFSAIAMLHHEKRLKRT